MPDHRDIDWDAIRARVAAAKNNPEAPAHPELEEPALDITGRMDNRGAHDLNAIARRMFNN